MTDASRDAQAARRALLPIVRRAGARLLAAFERMDAADVHAKGAVDLVTRLDYEAQAILVDGLGVAFPGETVLAEEAPHAALRTDAPLWLVDPLDGTTNYVHGQPPFAVSVARWADGALQVGAVFAPYLRELFWAARGAGAWLGERRLAVSQETKLDAALLATGFPYDIRTNPHNNLRQWAHLAVRCRGLRRGGAASLDLAYVAAGRLDGYWEYRLKPWDLAAGALLVTEAGGQVTGIDAGEDWLWTGNLSATNGFLHLSLAAALDEARLGDARRHVGSEEGASLRTTGSSEPRDAGSV
jgi:myo-inositol-1(or 4)-monophosphatase